jgi:hypothetical protein
MQDRPTAVELLQAAREFCERELGPGLTGRMRFQVRVLQNILGILEREWEQEEPALIAERDRLGQMLEKAEERPSSLTDLAAQVRTWNVELAAQIRSGALDDSSDELLEMLSDTIAEKIAIANPTYVSSATSAGASARSTR